MKHQEIRKTKTTLSNGYLGSRNDEERSEMRYVMRIAELSESSNL
jgi:trehalose/maltose hydrolase-like predicted phosphorylase